MTTPDTLRHALARIEAVFDVDAIIAQELQLDDIQAYYEQSHLGYQLLHSFGGSVHMSLSEDHQSLTHDYTVQVAAVARELDASMRQVLELGSGKGFNLQHLAQQQPRIHFQGVDLTPLHARSARRRLQSTMNADIAQADFHCLPFGDQHFDLVYDIESLCHALDMPQALRESYRVMTSGGLFILFDGFRIQPTAMLTADQQRARYLIEKTLGVDTGIRIADFVALAEEVGFEVLTVEDISAQIMPNLQHLRRLVNILLPTTWHMRIARTLFPPHLARNMISALLMPHLVGEGIQGYFKIILKA